MIEPTDPKLMTLADWADRMQTIPMNLDWLDTNPLVEDMLRLHPFKPSPWYKRWVATIGDWLINLGIRLGGSYDY